MRQKKKTKANSKKRKWVWALSFLFVMLFILIISLLAYRETEEVLPTADFYVVDTLKNSTKDYKDYAVHGIDISFYQKNIDWVKLSQLRIYNRPITFCYIKACQGTNSVDSYFSKNWTQAKQAKIIRGAYLYFVASKDGVLQAQNFINVLKKIEPGDLPPVVDVEHLQNSSPDEMTRNLKKCLMTLENYYKVKPIIYTYAGFYERYLNTDFNNYPLWVAHYLVNEKKPDVKRKWQFWQYNNKGRIKGLPVEVDLNVFNGDERAFKSILVK
ncbi:MAG: GH25 family lysozyme [Phycisphaerales bacterium]|nr:GH25 family lysozyme [Phycisphaerales bacterium]